MCVMCVAAGDVVGNAVGPGCLFHEVDWVSGAPPWHMFWLERDLYLVPPPQDTEPAAQLLHEGQQLDGQVVHVAGWVCGWGPKQLF